MKKWKTKIHCQIYKNKNKIKNCRKKRKDKNLKKRTETQWRIIYQSQVRPLLDEKSLNKWICFWNMQILSFVFQIKELLIFNCDPTLIGVKKSTIHQEKSGEWTTCRTDCGTLSLCALAGSQVDRGRNDDLSWIRTRGPVRYFSMNILIWM